MRKKPEQCGIAPFVAVNPHLAHLTSLTQDTPVRCRHEACNFEFFSAKDVEKAIAGKKDETGRYVSPVGHMWRHETQLFRHPLCNKQTCAVCIYIAENLMSMQKGGVNSDTLALSSSPTTATTTTTNALAGAGVGGGSETNIYAEEGIVAPSEEPSQAAVEEHVEGAEASI